VRRGDRYAPSSRLIETNASTRESHAVNPTVNSPKNEASRCIERTYEQATFVGERAQGSRSARHRSRFDPSRDLAQRLTFRRPRMVGRVPTLFGVRSSSPVHSEFPMPEVRPAVHPEVRFAATLRTSMPLVPLRDRARQRGTAGTWPDVKRGGAALLVGMNGTGSSDFGAFHSGRRTLALALSRLGASHADRQPRRRSSANTMALVLVNAWSHDCPASRGCPTPPSQLHRPAARRRCLA
jgi:hypothetical protein